MSERHPLYDEFFANDPEFERKYKEWKDLLIRFAKAMENLQNDELIKVAALKIGIRIEVLPVLRDFNDGKISATEMVIRATKYISGKRSNQ